jgi:hypothetical protein
VVVWGVWWCGCVGVCGGMGGCGGVGGVVVWGVWWCGGVRVWGVWWCGGVGLWGCGGVVDVGVCGVCGGVGGGGVVGVVSPCVRTFQGLHSVRLWTPTILFVGTRLFICLTDRNGFFIKTTNLSQSNWIQAIQGQTDLPATTIECASLCKQFDDTNDTQSQCNVFKFDKPSKICYLAEVTFLEDHQPGIVNEKFNVAFDVTKNVKLVCYGGDHCCRAVQKILVSICMYKKCL